MHRFLPLALPLTLLACNGGSSPTASPEQAARTVAASPTPPPVDAGTTPQPRDPRRFGDWAVGCDNVATCQAGSLAPEAGEPPAVSLSIERAAGPDATIAIRLRGRDPIALPLTIGVDGDVVARGGTTRDRVTELTGAPASAIARRMAQGRALSIADASGRTVATLSLAGAAAALRWIDAQQGRDGTTGAIVARGDRDDARAAPAAPVVRAAPIRGEAALIDPLRVTQMRQQAQCAGDDLPDVTIKPLGNGRTLAVVPCTMGAYNVLSALFVIERGAVTLAAFDLPPGGDAGGETPLVFNAAFDDGILDAHARGRGLGDCGVSQRYAWDGTRFRLIEQREMTECRGNIDFPRTWTARLVR